MFRDSSVRISYLLISQTPFANRHRVVIDWTKAQEIPPEPASSGAVDVYTDATQHVYAMSEVATPDSKQSEAFIATFALFHIFGSSQKEERVCMRLPAAWRELWNELLDTRKNVTDAKCRDDMREIRDLVRKKHNQEIEDGVIIQGAFKGRGLARASSGDVGDDAGQDRLGAMSASPEYYRRIWTEKSNTLKFRTMLVSILSSCLTLLRAVPQTYHIRTH